MEQIYVDVPGNGYPVYMERGLLGRCGACLPPEIERWFILCDETVAAYYAETVTKSIGARHGGTLTFPAGEGSKSLAVYEDLCRRLLVLGITRRSGILALGGGVSGDLAGFVAATVLRGVALVHLPTTLLAQVDSSIGGKTGLDLPEGKNLLGAFYQPRMVLIDPDCLTTLPRREWCSGMAEVIKYGMIADREILQELESESPNIFALIRCCCGIKAALVARDERDGGARRLLNFGHTFGHVYEAWGNFSRWTHGEAVAAGMMQILRWQVRHGDDVEALQARLGALLEKFSLPLSISCPVEQARCYLLRDKKRSGDTISIVRVRQAGSAEVEAIPVEELWEGWNE